MSDSAASFSARMRIIRWETGGRSECEDEVAGEEPLEIRVEGRSIAVVMRTPGHDRELVAGFALTEGIIKSASDVFDITTCANLAEDGRGNVVDLLLARPGAFDESRFTRHVFTSSSCGVCSKASIDAVMMDRPRIESRFSISAETVLRMPDALAQRQETFRRTGGLHACALFGADGTLIALREDVGRHNALDKLIGWALLRGMTPLDQHAVLLSGRTSFEMMQKAHAAGIPLVASISAPSSLAVEFARESGQTLAGFVRGASMNIYAGGERLL